MSQAVVKGCMLRGNVTAWKALGSIDVPWGYKKSVHHRQSRPLVGYQIFRHVCPSIPAGGSPPGLPASLPHLSWNSNIRLCKVCCRRCMPIETGGKPLAQIGARVAKERVCTKNGHGVAGVRVAGSASTLISKLHRVATVPCQSMR